MLAEDIELPLGIGKLPRSLQLTEETISLLLRAGVNRLAILDPALRQTGSQVTAAPGTVAAHAEDGAEALPLAALEQAVAPRLKVAIAPDGMSAGLTIDPAGPVSGEISYEILLSTIENAGVSSGLNRGLIPEIILKWKNHKRHYEFSALAKGTAAEAGREGAFSAKVRHVADPSDEAILRDAHYYWQAAERLGKLERVARGTVVAERLFDTPPKPGLNVRGETVDAGPIVPANVTLREGVAFSADRRQLIAETDGVLFFDGETIGLYALDFNGSFELSIDNNTMAARLIVRPPGDGGRMPPRQDIDGLLFSSRVTTGMKEDAIAALVDGFAQGHFPREPVVVAAGIPAKNGDNGKVEFLFNTTTSLSPKVNPDGSVDYKNVEIIISVPKGKVLARMQPPTKGTPGANIFGEPLPCKDGAPGTLPIGPNTETSPDDDDALIASIDGIVRYTGFCVEVCEGYIIKGDVDFSTGNIKYDKSVIINGDIKAGFSVECGGDLQVAGIIEDCTVTVGGNVLCKHGFIGQGKGTIEAKGDVNLGFIMNQTVKSRKSVNIAKEAINSTVYARHSICVHGKPLSIAGGTFVARELISVYTVGNQSGVRTNLEVGLDFALEEELKKNEEQEADIGPKRQKLIESVTKYNHLTSLRRRLSAQEELLFNKLKLAVAKIDEQLQLLDRRKKIIQSKLHELENAHVKIEHSAMPGTLIKIGERRHFLKEEVIGPKTVRLIRQEISVL